MRSHTYFTARCCNVTKMANFVLCARSVTPQAELLSVYQCFNLFSSNSVSGGAYDRTRLELDVTRRSVSSSSLCMVSTPWWRHPIPRADVMDSGNNKHWTAKMVGMLCNFSSCAPKLYVLRSMRVVLLQLSRSWQITWCVIPRLYVSTTCLCVCK